MSCTIVVFLVVMIIFALKFWCIIMVVVSVKFCAEYLVYYMLKSLGAKK